MTQRRRLKQAQRLVFVKTLAPAAPSPGSVVLFYNTKTGAISVKKSDGSIVSLER